jgi:hypothetical protein
MPRHCSRGGGAVCVLQGAVCIRLRLGAPAAVQGTKAASGAGAKKSAVVAPCCQPLMRTRAGGGRGDFPGNSAGARDSVSCRWGEGWGLRFCLFFGLKTEPVVWCRCCLRTNKKAGGQGGDVGTRHARGSCRRKQEVGAVSSYLAHAQLQQLPPWFCAGPDFIAATRAARRDKPGALAVADAELGGPSATARALQRGPADRCFR